MQTTYDILALVHHGIGYALVAALVVWLFLRQSVVATITVWAARLQLLLGLAQVGIAEGALHHGMNHAFVGTKLVLALAGLACIEMANARFRKERRYLPMLIAGAVLFLAAFIVALTWH